MLKTLDPLGFHRIARPEPLRLTPYLGMVAAPRAPLLYMPIKAGPEERVTAWLARLDREAPAALRRGFSPGGFRDWQAAHPGHRCFTVLSHPLERAHRALATHLLMPGPQRYGKIRGLLRDHYGLDFPGSEFAADYDRARHRQLLLDFLTFLRRNLAGNSSIRIDPAWASQEAVVQLAATVRPPDLLLREDRLAEDLSGLAAAIGRKPPKLAAPERPGWPFTLADIYDAEVEAAARLAYARDYAAFGFADWVPATPP